jgi:RNA polymerase sigma-70 factor, ECF subfamily
LAHAFDVKLVTTNLPAATLDALPVSAVADANRSAADVSDSALMLRYRDGDVQAFHVLYARHKHALYRYLQRICRNSDIVHDLFQEVWSKVVQASDRYQARAEFGALLMRIAHNCAVDYFRRAERQHIGRMLDVGALQELLPGTAGERPDAQTSEQQLQRAFEVALGNLPDEQRNVFVLYEESGMTLEEIGTVTGVGFETVKSRLRYALTKLRHALRQYDPHATEVQS